MRLILFSVIILISVGARAAIDVPGQADTVAHAFQTATATPNSSIFVSSGITENISFPNNPNQSITLTGCGATITNSGTSDTIAFTNTAGFFSLSNLTIQNTDPTSNGRSAIRFNPGTAAATVLVDSVNSVGANTAVGIQTNPVFSSGQKLIVRKFTCSGGGRGIWINQASAQTQTGGASFSGVLFRGPFATAGFISPTDNTVNFCNVYYSDFIGCSLAVTTGGGVSFVNSIWSNNTTDRGISGHGSGANDFLNCAYTNSNANPGTGSITIIAARTFCDVNNYYLNPAGPCWSGGTSIVNITGTDLGLDGVVQGNGRDAGTSGMGCFAGTLAWCGGYKAGK